MLIRCFSPWFVSQTGVLEIKPNRKARKGNARKGQEGYNIDQESQIGT